jgi:hypothetical protein
VTAVARFRGNVEMTGPRCRRIVTAVARFRGNVELSVSRCGRIVTAGARFRGNVSGVDSRDVSGLCGE